MRRYRKILVAVLICAGAILATGAFAGERADWGAVMYVGTASDGGMLLIENDRGIHTLLVDPYGEVRTAAGESATLSTIKPNDHIDFAVSSWAGMSVVDLVHVAPSSQGKLASTR